MRFYPQKWPWKLSVRTYLDRSVDSDCPEITDSWADQTVPFQPKYITKVYFCDILGVKWSSRASLYMHLKICISSRGKIKIEKCSKLTRNVWQVIINWIKSGIILFLGFFIFHFFEKFFFILFFSRFDKETDLNINDKGCA